MIRYVLIFIIYFLLVINLKAIADSFRYDSKGKRDPFVPLIYGGGAHVSDVYSITGIKDIRLEGIVWDEKGDSIAIINGEIVKPGQEFGAIKLLRIEKDGVVFDVNGEELKIDLITD